MPKVNVASHVTRVRGLRAEGETADHANAAKAHQRDNRSMTIRDGGIGAARL